MKVKFTVSLAVAGTGLLTGATVAVAAVVTDSAPVADVPDPPVVPVDPVPVELVPVELEPVELVPVEPAEPDDPHAAKPAAAMPAPSDVRRNVRRVTASNRDIELLTATSGTGPRMRLTIRPESWNRVRIVRWQPSVASADRLVGAGVSGCR